MTGVSRGGDIRKTTGEEDEGVCGRVVSDLHRAQHCGSYTVNFMPSQGSWSSLRSSSSASVGSFEASSTCGVPGAGCCPQPQLQGTTEQDQRDKGASFLRSIY